MLVANPNTAVFGGIEGITVGTEILHLFIVRCTGMLLGLEREWANRSAGIRTCTLTSLVGAAAMSLNETILRASWPGYWYLICSLGRPAVRPRVDRRRVPRTLRRRRVTRSSASRRRVTRSSANHVLIGVIIGITSTFLPDGEGDDFSEVLRQRVEVGREEVRVARRRLRLFRLSCIRSCPAERTGHGMRLIRNWSGCS